MDEQQNNDNEHISNDDESVIQEEKPKISKLAKFITLILRHQPGALSLELDNDGWLSCTVDELVILINEKKNFEITREDIEEIVSTDPKGRYEILENAIRATYGHSVKLNPLETPDDIEDLPQYVYYATNNYQLDTMLRLGLVPREKRDRQYLHLSVEIKDAYTVAKHHSRNPKLVRIDVQKAHEYGVKFRKVAPLIVVCDEVPSQFIEEISLPEDLKYLEQLNPEKRYEKRRSRYSGKRRYQGSERRTYKDNRRNYKPGHKQQSGDTRKRYQKPQKPTIEDDDEIDYKDYDTSDFDFDDPAEFGDVDDIKKKAKSRSTIHFETQSDEDVEFS